MAWPSGRLWRVCRVGVGVCVCGVCRRWCTVLWRVWVRCAGVCGYRAMACVGTVCRRWVYVWLACVYALGVCRVVYVVCTLCVSFYDVT